LLLTARGCACSGLPVAEGKTQIIARPIRDRKLRVLTRDGKEFPNPMKRLVLSLITTACLSSAAYAQGTPSISATSPAVKETVNAKAAEKKNPAPLVVNNGLLGTTGGPITDENYVIGPEDVITVFVWKEPDLTQTLAVRPDGKISLPLLNDLEASGSTTAQLKERIISGLKQYIASPTVTVIVQAARSQKASIIGEVTKPGTYLLNGPTNLLQLISLAGGFRDFASTDKVNVIRQENGKTVNIKFNYRDFVKGKNLNQNIQLRPGDIIVVP
jgi:polysaccharide biosynthesis/export protein